VILRADAKKMRFSQSIRCLAFHLYNKDYTSSRQLPRHVHSLAVLRRSGASDQSLRVVDDFEMD
jgi:hypothetical protein